MWFKQDTCGQRTRIIPCIQFFAVAVPLASAWVSLTLSMVSLNILLNGASLVWLSHPLFVAFGLYLKTPAATLNHLYTGRFSKNLLQIENTSLLVSTSCTSGKLFPHCQCRGSSPLTEKPRIQTPSLGHSGLLLVCSKHVKWSKMRVAKWCLCFHTGHWYIPRSPSWQGYSVIPLFW